MFSLRRPSDRAIARLLEQQAGLPYSYREVGVTHGDGGPTMRRSHHRVKLGAGEETYLAAVAALRAWTMYDLPWTEVQPPGAPAPRSPR